MLYCDPIIQFRTYSKLARRFNRSYLLILSRASGLSWPVSSFVASMSELLDCKQSAESGSRKRSSSPDQDESDKIPQKFTKVTGQPNENAADSESCNNCESDNKETAKEELKKDGEQADALQTNRGSEHTGDESSQPVNSSNAKRQDSSAADKLQSSDVSVDLKEETAKTIDTEQLKSNPVDQSDSAAIAAAEALASLTGRDEEDSQETPCSSEKAKQGKHGNKFKQGGGHQSKSGLKTQAAAADSSTSVRSAERKDVADAPEADEGEESVSGSSSTPSSSFPSENEDNEDGECAIVSVKMAPEIRQSVALLAQVQMRLDALEKKSARLHQRLEQKMSCLRRPQLDQRSSITKSIPGFWVTALLNHPHLSAHIDETDEDALSYMTDLEIESFKNNKMGYRIRFHFRRNPYFQNNIIMKELHLGMGGPPMSFSNPILWHRGHNLTAHSEPRKSSRGVYETFFSWFSDHSNPGVDDVAQILKDDLYRDPLRYYLTPLWEPRENGSSGAEARAAANSNGDDCVVISDSDEDPTEEAKGSKRQSREEEEEGEEGEEEEEEEEEEEGEEEEDGDRGQSANESPEEEEEGEEEDGGEEIVIDGSDDSDPEEEEDEA